jgi:2-polyprenyl-3-methyl-5-hydroxy-6-metoxy-1,4-benzoquinol methylase
MADAIFDGVAVDYDSWYETDLGKAVDQVERALAQKMFQTSGQQVLEVGCGTGQYTSWLVREGYEVTAVDISVEMMARAQANLSVTGGKVHWWQADIANIIDQLGKYHGIFAMTSFEFISQPEWVLAKLYACLEPGGCLVIGVIAGNSPWSEYYQETARQKPTSVFSRAQFYTEEEICHWQVGGCLELRKSLFFPPSVATAAEALALEERQEGRAGFIVAKWVKG